MMQPPGSNLEGRWAEELVAIGYGGHLPPPSPSVQATLAALSAPDLHKFIIPQDTEALADTDDEGQSAPLFLTTLDLCQWTWILSLEIEEPGKGLKQLQKVQHQLSEILDSEAEDLEFAMKHTKLIDTAIRQANPQETTVSVSSPGTGPSSSVHKLLRGINVASAEKAALEDMSSSISTSQCELDTAALVASGKGPVVPLTPARTVEFLAAQKGSRCWTLPNINLMAPITTPMWKTWANMTNVEVESLQTNAVQNSGLLREPQSIPHPFPLSLFENSKCNIPLIKIHTKLDLNTGYGRTNKHSSTLWNCQRPYLRCTCSKDALSGCRGDIMWFDHAVFFMVNNLGIFFGDEVPSLSAKFGAFLVWLSDAARVGVRYQVSFEYSRNLMIEAALQFSADPKAKLLPNLPKSAPGVRKIERLIKPASFSATNPNTPTLAPPGKRQRMNLNAPPKTPVMGYMTNQGAHRRNQNTFGNRGGYNRNSRNSQQRPTFVRGQNVQQPGENDAFVFMTTSRHRQQLTRQDNRPSMEAANVVQQQVSFPSQNFPHGAGGTSWMHNRQHQPMRIAVITEAEPEPVVNPSPTNRPPIPSSSSSTRSNPNPRFDLSSMRGRILEWGSTDT